MAGIHLQQKAYLSDRQRPFYPRPKKIRFGDKDQPRQFITTATGSVAELRLRLRQQEVVAAFLRFILGSNSLQSMLDEGCRAAVAGMGCEWAAVLEHRPADNDFFMRASVGWRPDLVGIAVPDAGGTVPACATFPTGKAVLSGGSVTGAGFAETGRIIDHGVTQGLDVLIAMPGCRFGVLAVGGSGGRDFDGSDTLFLQTLADLLAMALARQRLVDTCALAAEKTAAAELRMLEAHHRVKNSLQLVQSLLLLQGRATLDRKASADLVVSAARIRTIAAIHDRLYRIGSSSSTMQVAPYLTGLVEDLCAGMLSTTQGRRIVLVADPVVWPVNDLCPLGLILTELVINAIKYGAGVITVMFRQPIGSNGILTVYDEGQLPAGLDPASSNGFGMRMIRTLLRGEDAGLEIDRRHGDSRFVCHMPPNRIVNSADIPVGGNRS